MSCIDSRIWVLLQVKKSHNQLIKRIIVRKEESAHLSTFTLGGWT